MSYSEAANAELTFEYTSVRTSAWSAVVGRVAAAPPGARPGSGARREAGNLPELDRGGDVRAAPPRRGDPIGADPAGALRRLGLLGLVGTRDARGRARSGPRPGVTHRVARRRRPCRRTWRRPAYERRRPRGSARRR